jgi:hypothetical protein
LVLLTGFLLPALLATLAGFLSLLARIFLLAALLTALVRVLGLLLMLILIAHAHFLSM